MNANGIGLWLRGGESPSAADGGATFAPDAAKAFTQAATQAARQAIDTAIDTAVNKAQQTVEGVQQKWEQIQPARWDQTVLPTAQLPNPQTWMTQPLQNWLSEHPIVAWMVHNPLWALGAALLGVLLLSGLIKAVARFSEQAWLSVLQSPFRLGQWLLGAAAKPTQPRAIGRSIQAGEQQERLDQILSQLEALRLQQEALIQELKVLLAAQEKK